MAELRAFYVNPSKIPDEPLEVVFAHCAYSDIKAKFSFFLLRHFVGKFVFILFTELPQIKKLHSVVRLNTVGPNYQNNPL